MRKAILCLIFTTALLGQPTGVQVDLSVVSVDSSSGEVCFKADARPDGAIFDGTDDHITIPDHADLNFGTDGDFTIEAWFKADAVGRQNPIVCKLIGSNPNFTGYQLWIAPDNKLKAFICDGSYTLVASSSTITANTWYYAAFTVDRDGNEKIYLNGSLDCTPVNVSGVGNINTDTTLWIGRATHSPSLAFDGTIAEVRISDKVRSDAEIADAYADGGEFENDANTIALWQLNEDTGTATGDSSGNGHSGTLTNGAAWGDGLIVNPIQGATWTTGPLPTPPEFTYDYDWGNDATYDLTDTGDSVCHTYTPGDSLWAKVQATTPTYTAEDSAEVIVPEEEEYTFEVLRTEADWESYNIRIYDLVTDDEGKLWLAGVQRPYNQGIRIDTITGEIDTLYDLDEMGYYDVRNKHVLRKFSHQVNIDTIITQFDTVFLPETEFDSLVVQPLFSDYPPWAITEKFINPGIIGSSGYYFAQLADSERKDSLYPGWKYAIGKDGELKHKIDLQLGQYTGSCSGNYFALQYGIGVDSGYTNLTLCDTSGAILWTKQILYYSLLRFGWDSGEPGIPKKYILQPNGNAFYLRGPEDELKLVMTNLLGDYEFAIPLADSMTRLMIGNLFAEDERLLLHTMETYPDTDINRIYFFDISDSLRVLWSTVAKEIEPDKFGILTDGNPYITGCQISDYFSGIIDVFSRNDGSLITTLPDEPIRSSCWGKSVVHGDLILYLGCKEGGGFVPQAKLIKIKVGE